MDRPAIDEKMVSAIRTDDVDALSQYDGETLKSARDAKGQNPLFYAVRQKAHNVLSSLLKAGADATAKNHFNDTPFHVAAHLGDDVSLEMMLASMGSTPHRNKKKQTPLMLAARKGSLSCVRLLSEPRARLDDLDAEGRCVLMYAVRSKKLKVVDFLIARGVNVHHINRKKESSLHLACAYALPSIVERLLEEGVNAFLKNIYGQNALHYAVHTPMESVVDRLLDIGLDGHEKDVFGESPFSKAQKRHDATALTTFTRHENDPRSREGIPRLHQAVRARKVDIVHARLQEADSIDRKDAYGNTPLFYAMMNEDTYLTTFLLENGARVTDIDKAGRNALFHAIVQQNDTVLSYLSKEKKQALMTEDVRALLEEDD